MTLLIWGLIIFLAVGFAGVLLVGAPYVPSLKSQRRAALKLLDLKSGQTLYDFGCGDGSLLMLAASRGIKGVGYELNPLLAAIAWVRTRRYGGMVKIRCGNFWRAPITDADGLFVFLLDRFMPKLDKLISSECSKPIALASNAFKIPGKKANAEMAGVYLYRYRPLAKKA